MALVDPAGHAYPAAQFPEQADELRPEVPPKVPAGHCPLHVADVNSLPSPKVPTGHSVHAPAPLKLYWPVGHLDAIGLELVDPGGHACPAVQFPEHPADAIAAVLPYRPALQLVQLPAPPVRLYWPAGHVTAVALVDPAGHAHPALQLPEHPADAIAAVMPYSPALQLVQLPAPVRLYWPAGHVTAVALVDPSGHAYPAVHDPLQEGLLDAPNRPEPHNMHNVSR
jgi:hypothetical protein